MKHLRNSSPTSKLMSLSSHVGGVPNGWLNGVDGIYKIYLVVRKPKTSPTSVVVRSYILSAKISIRLNPTLKWWINHRHILCHISLQFKFRRPPNWRFRTTSNFSSGNLLHSLRNLEDEHRVNNLVAYIKIDGNH